MGLFRLLLLLGLGYIVYRYVEKWIAGSQQRGSRSETTLSAEAEDVLVEDPVCHTYIPRTGAVSCTIEGRSYFFCSAECREKFQSELRSNA